jgi:hypothetical protein
MTIRKRLSAVDGRLARAWVVAMALAIPAIAGASDKNYQDVTLVDGPVHAEDSWVGKGTTTGVKAKNWVFVIKVGEYQYAAYADRVGGIFAGKGPQKEDWPQSSTVKAHFHHRMGSLYVDLKSPTGKEEEDLWVFSKKGQDGKELCGSFKCEKTPEDGDD